MALGERLRDPSPTMIGKTSRMPLRIMIVDDHPVFRTGLVNLLSSEDDFEIVAAVPSGDAAVEALHAVPPHVVLLDLSMPGEGGFDTLARMRDARPGVKVVVLTSSESSLDVDHARAAGAAGFLTKQVDHLMIIAAIRDVHHGVAWVQHGVIRPVAQPSADGLPLGISSRELEVLSYVRNGYSNVEIGRLLGIAPRTVKAHVKALCEKLGASDRTEAVARGFDLGLLKAEARG
jgi:DNA-binding NarL/FixJ family response regulator